MSRRGQPCEQLYSSIVYLALFCFGCTKPWRELRNIPCGDQGSPIAHKFFELSQRVQRNTLDSGQNDHAIVIGAEHERVLINSSDLSQRIVVKKVKVVSRFQYRGYDVRSNSLAEDFYHVRVAVGEMRPGVVIGKVKGYVVRRLALPE